MRAKSASGASGSAPRHIAEIGYLPEERGLYKKMKVGEQLLYLARLKGLTRAEATQRIKAWLQRLDLTAWAEKNVEDLSKGMQQKVQFIATVLHEPKIIILDEPFSGFDPINANLIKDEILALREQGRNHHLLAPTAWNRWRKCATTSPSSTAAARCSMAR